LCASKDDNLGFRTIAVLDAKAGVIMRRGSVRELPVRKDEAQ